MKEIFSPQVLQQIKERINLVDFVGRYVDLNRSLKAKCPFHSEKTPSFSIHPKKQIWRCFGCGVHGNIFTFVMLIEKFSFPNAVKLLANEAGVPLPKSERFKGYLARRWEVKKKLFDHFQVVRFYLKQAQFDKENQLRLERKDLSPRIKWNSWDAKDFLKEQVIDYRFDWLRDKMRKIEEGLYRKEQEVRGYG